jgi:hypothetical protein
MTDRTLDEMDRTLKMPAYKAAVTETSNLTREQELELALAKKTAQAEDERKKALDTLTILEQVREVHKKDVAKAADLQNQLNAARIRIRELEGALEKIASLAIAPGRPAEE